jgi:hypothetical protein
MKDLFMPEKLVSQKEAARIAGVKQSSISALRKSEKWGFFVGSKVNVLDPSWYKYLNSRGLTPWGNIPEIENGNGNSVEDIEMMELEKDERLEESIPDYDHIMENDFAEPDMMEAYRKWRAKLTEESFKKKRLEREKLEGSLIPLDFIEKILGEYVALLHKRFLDLPQNKSDRIMQIIESKPENLKHQIVKMLTREIELNLQQTKKEIERNLERYGKEL